MSVRQRMQETLYQTADAEVLYQTAEAGDTYLIEDAGVYQTADAGVSIRQRTQESLYQTADAEVSLPDSGCRRHSIRQRM